MFKAFAHLIASIFVSGFMLFVIGAVVAWGAFTYFSQDLPDYSTLTEYEPKTITRLYASDGKFLAEYAIEKRLYVPLGAIPKRLIEAFLSAEDRNFYEHRGIDFYGVMRAVRDNIRNYGTNRPLVGGSTITQQVVKNFLLSNEKSLSRKIKEAILAFRISKVYSKDRILELYLNEIYLGGGSYGVAAATLNYFNKSLEELTLEEAALLAALPKAPSDYDPRFRSERARERRDWVLSRMMEDGKISAEEAYEATMKPIVLSGKNKSEIAQADFFAEEVRRQLGSMYGSNVLYEQGLYVLTTLDPQLQRHADKALREALFSYDRRHGYRGPIEHLPSLDSWKTMLEEIVKQSEVPLYDDHTLAVVTSLKADRADIGIMDGTRGAIALDQLKWARKQVGHLRRGKVIGSPSDVLKVGDVILVRPMEDGKEAGAYELLQIPEVNGAFVALDPHSGRVLALSGGYSYGKTEFNRATQAKRQPGSAFKPFVYLAGMENGFSPATVVVDGPVTLSQGDGMPDWTPQNYSGDFLGPTPLRIGLEKSRNTMTVRLAQMIGIGKVREVGERFGIYESMPKHFSAVLGSVETTLLRLVNAYAILVNGGKRINPAMIERIDDRYGKTIYKRDKRDCPTCRLSNEPRLVQAVVPTLPDTRATIVDDRAAYQVISMLQGVVERGTGARARKLGKVLGGKTGTTNDSKDTWFIGFSPDLVAGIYIGFDKPKSLGRKETGSSVSLPGFIQFMGNALTNRPSKPFTIPKGVTMMKVDRYTGQPPLPGTDPKHIILEAFKRGQNPGDVYSDVAFEDWETENIYDLNDPQGYSGVNPSAEGSWDPGYYSPRRQEQWENRWEPTRSYTAPSQTPSSYYSPDTDRRRPPLNPVQPQRVQPELGTGGLY